MFFILLLVSLLIGGAVIALAFLNLTNRVQLSYYLGLSPYFSLGLLLLAAFLLGALVLFLLSTHGARKDRKEIEQLRQRVRDLEQEKGQTPQRMPTGPLPAPMVSGVVPMPGSLGPSQSGITSMPPNSGQMIGNVQPLPPLPQQPGPVTQSNASNRTVPGFPPPPSNLPGNQSFVRKNGNGPQVPMPGMPPPPQQ